MEACLFCNSGQKTFTTWTITHRRKELECKRPICDACGNPWIGKANNAEENVEEVPGEKTEVVWAGGYPLADMLRRWLFCGTPNQQNGNVRGVFKG